VAPHTIFVCHALIVEDFSDLVRLMAINARWQGIRFRLPQLTFDDLAVD
jgi:hypothetical protein